MILYRPRWSAIYSTRWRELPELSSARRFEGIRTSLPRSVLSLGARQRRDVKPRMLVNKVARIEDVPLNELPYWDWLLYPSAYPRWNP